MYISNRFQFNVKQEENKCNRIFRPWDNSDSDNDTMPDTSQDSTITTTTTETESEIVKVEESESKPSETGFRPPTKVTTGSPNKSTATLPISEYPHAEAYPQLYPDMFQANMAQSLGLTTSDPLFLESMAHGYALEEYARVLNQEHQTKILQARKQRPKKYKCPHCDVGFSNNGQLKGHIRIHTGERPFKCDEKDCGKTFTRNEELTRHKRIHSGLRPFPCTQCGKRFGRKDHLKKHSRTHFQPRGLYAVPVMLPYDTWASSPSNYPFVPMYGY